MKRNYCWEKTPARIVSIKKEKTDFGSFFIEAVLEESRNWRNVKEVGKITVKWAYAPTVRLSDGSKGNLAPACFEWAYKNAEVGMDVIIHHCMDDNMRYFYCSWKKWGARNSCLSWVLYESNRSVPFEQKIVHFDTSPNGYFSNL